jgi:RNAse (barnase) inhibitor barstar
MTEINLNGAPWQDATDFYTDLLKALEAPEWHGRNLDALWDSITAGAINGVNPPFTLRIHGCGVMGAPARAMVDRFRVLIEEAKSDGHHVELICD